MVDRGVICKEKLDFAHCLGLKEIPVIFPLLF